VFDVIDIGKATYDGFYKTDLKVVPYPETPTGKAFIVPLGEKIGIKEVYFTLGGNAANAAVTFARQGFKVSVVTRVGNDDAGEFIKKRLEKEGVDTKSIKTSSVSTAHSVLLLQEGERTILSYHGAVDEFSINDIDLDNLKSKWWYVSLSGESYKLFDKLLAVAKRLNVSVALNPSLKHLTEGRNELLKDLSEVSVLVLNEGEAAILTGIPFKEEARVFRRLDELVPGIVVVTSGDRGVTVSDGKFVYQAGTFKENDVVDRTGAGDAFGSGFVAGLIHRNESCKGRGVCSPDNIEYAIRLASANATSVVEHIGATEGVITKEEFESSDRFKNLPITKKATAV
jgi:ribokinase